MRDGRYYHRASLCFIKEHGPDAFTELSCSDFGLDIVVLSCTLRKKCHSLGSDILVDSLLLVVEYESYGVDGRYAGEFACSIVYRDADADAAVLTKMSSV